MTTLRTSDVMNDFLALLRPILTFRSRARPACRRLVPELVSVGLFRPRPLSKPAENRRVGRDLSWGLLAHRVGLQCRFALLHVDAELHRLASMPLEQLVAVLAQACS